MSNNGVDLSVVQLKRVLEKRKSKLTRLERQRNKILRELAKIEAQMAAISGGRKPGARTVRRPKNAKSLRETVLEILGRTKKGYSLSVLVEKILASGYKSSSGDFKNVVYQCVYHSEEIIHDAETGTYRMK